MTCKSDWKLKSADWVRSEQEKRFLKELRGLKSTYHY